MATRKAKFKQADIVRGLKAGQKLGIDFAVTVLPDGSLLFVRADKRKDAASTNRPKL